MSRKILPLLARIFMVVLCLSAVSCQSIGEGMSGRSIEEVSAEAREQMDRLAERIGNSPNVVSDSIGSCDPSDADAGQDLIYRVEVTSRPGVADRVRGEIAEDYRAEGWDVRERGSENVVFRRENLIMGVRWSSDERLASVGGSGGCVG